MPSESKVKKLAAALLTKKNIGIAEEIVQKHFDAAIAAKDKARVREISELLTIVEEVKNGEGE